MHPNSRNAYQRARVVLRHNRMKEAKNVRDKQRSAKGTAQLAFLTQSTTSWHLCFCCLKTNRTFLTWMLFMTLFIHFIWRGMKMNLLSSDENNARGDLNPSVLSSWRIRLLQSTASIAKVWTFLILWTKPTWSCSANGKEIRRGYRRSALFELAHRIGASL